MTWNAARVWKVAEPGLPVALYGAMVASDTVFKVESDGGAALVGVGMTAIIFVGLLLFAARKPSPRPGPMFTPFHLPWGAAFILCGIWMMQLREPWKYHGFGVLVIGALYLLLGAFAAVRASRLSTR